jgi:hypothetical protein
MNTAKRGIEGHFPDWDAHPSGTLIAESKNALAIAQHNALHLVKARMAQDLVDAMPIGKANEQAPRLSPNLAEALATFADSWGIHQWQHVFHVAKQKGIEQRFVCILQIAKKGIFAEGSGLLRQGRAPALHLVFEVPDVRRQQAVQVK